MTGLTVYVRTKAHLSGNGVYEALVTNRALLAARAVIEWKTRAAKWNIQP